MKSEISFKLLKDIGTIGINECGWAKELKLVSWQNQPAVYDVRAWSPDHSRMTKGKTFTKEELLQIHNLMKDFDFSSLKDICKREPLYEANEVNEPKKWLPSYRVYKIIGSYGEEKGEKHTLPKDIRIVEWNKTGDVKFDLRTWKDGIEPMTGNRYLGMTFTPKEMITFLKIIEEII